MSDLICSHCGLEATYADANIADIHETCEETRTVETPEGPRQVTVSCRHDWEEQS